MEVPKHFIKDLYVEFSFVPIHHCKLRIYAAYSREEVLAYSISMTDRGQGAVCMRHKVIEALHMQCMHPFYPRMTSVYGSYSYSVAVGCCGTVK